MQGVIHSRLLAKIQAPTAQAPLRPAHLHPGRSSACLSSLPRRRRRCWPRPRRRLWRRRARSCGALTFWLALQPLQLRPAVRMPGRLPPPPAGVVANPRGPWPAQPPSRRRPAQGQGSPGCACAGCYPPRRRPAACRCRRRTPGRTAPRLCRAPGPRPGPGVRGGMAESAAAESAVVTPRPWTPNQAAGAA